LSTEEHVESLLEAKRKLDLTFDLFMRKYEAARPRLRFDGFRYLDKARTEVELAEHWIAKLNETLEAAIASGGCA
jgi:hypothetical protein